MKSNKDHSSSLPYQFIAFPTPVLRSSEYQGLSFSAKALLVDIAAQYTGKNNGRLTPAFAAMEKVGWRSKTTLIKAKRELITASFVVVTRRGHAPKTAEWVGLTWWRTDWHRTMNLQPREANLEYLNFQKLRLVEPTASANRSREKKSEVQEKAA